MSRRRKAASAALALAVTGGCLVLAARNVRFAELRDVLSRARWAWLVPLVGISLADLAIRAVRWRILLKRAADAPAPLMFRLEAIGIALNNVLFMRLGEVARAFLAARDLGVPTMTVLASVAVERALDVAALLTLFSIASAGAPELVPLPLRRAGPLALAAAIGALVMLAFAEKPLLPGGAWERRLRRWPALHKLVAQLAAGAAVLREPLAAGQAALLSLLLWSIDAGFYWAGARALDLGSIVDYPRSILILSWAGAGAALPAAPGAFGTFEALVKSILVDLGAPDAAAFGYAVFNHMIGYIIVTVLGLAFLWKVELSLAELQTALSKEQEK